MDPPQLSDAAPLVISYSVMYTQIYPVGECYLGLAIGKLILETPVLSVPSTASDA